MIAPNDSRHDVRCWAEELHVEPKAIHIRPMKRKLASCSSRGRFTFDVSLLNEDRRSRAEAILHELL